MEQNYFPKTRHMAFSLIPDTHTHTHVCSSLCVPSFPGNLENPGTCNQSNAVAAFPLNFSQMPFPFTLQQTLPQLASPFLYYRSSVTPSQFPQALCPVLPTLWSSTIIFKSNVLNFFQLWLGCNFLGLGELIWSIWNVSKKWRYTHLLIYKPHYSLWICKTRLCAIILLYQRLETTKTCISRVPLNKHQQIPWRSLKETQALFILICTFFSKFL